MGTILLVMFLWFMFGVTASSIAGAKGYNAWVWLLVGFMFGPFALAVAFYPTKVKAPPAGSAAAMRACPFCAEPVLAAAIKCKHCGSELTPVVPKAAAPAVSTASTPEEEATARRSAAIWFLGGLALLALLSVLGRLVTR